MGICLALAVVGSLLVGLISRGTPGNPARALRINPVGGIWGTLRKMRSDRLLLTTVFTLSSFWLVSGIFRSNMPLFGKLDLGVTADKASLLMAFVSVGIGVGAGLASTIKEADRSMGLVLPGVMGMSLSSIAVGILGHSFLPSGLMLSVLGVFGGFYLVPQTTIFQARSPAELRGEYLGVQNFFTFSFMLIAALLFDLMTTRLHFKPKMIFFTVGLGLCGLGVIQAALQPALLLGQLRSMLGGAPPLKKKEVPA
jgi:LPLT family lysophospholipid transporter-like MFS transporter